jgi:hypothetical protein
MFCLGWGRCKKEDSAGLRHLRAVPGSLGHDAGGAGRERQGPLGIPVVQEELHLTVEEVDQLVAQRVTFPPRPVALVVEDRQQPAIAQLGPFDQRGPTSRINCKMTKAEIGGEQDDVRSVQVHGACVNGPSHNDQREATGGASLASNLLDRAIGYSYGSGPR